MYGTPLPNISKEGDKYGFVNETEIRISTGITLVLGLFSLFLVLFKAEYGIVLFLVTPIWIDFFIKVFIGPKYSIFGSFVRIFLGKKDPIWTGAIQKRFAWSIGLMISSFVMLCLVMLGKYSSITNPILEGIWKITAENIANNALIVAPMNPAIIACVLCIIFMWSESVVGYCVGCSIYAWLLRKGWIRGYKNQNCIDGTCEIR